MFNTLIYAEHTNGKLKNTAFELICKASEFSQTISVAMIGKNTKDLAPTLFQYGASKVFLIENDALLSYTAEGYSQALASLIKENNFNVFLAPSSLTGKDYLPRLAFKLDCGMASDCVDLECKEGKLFIKRPLYAGKAFVQVSINSSCQIISVRPNVLTLKNPDSSRSGEVVHINPATMPKIKAIVKELLKKETAKVDLTEATIIVSGGRSMKNAENFKILDDLADVLGATVGASRAAVDSGFAPHNMQVGQTGKTVNPTLYIACGISGAIQHLAGMRTSKVIVAINTDTEAPIFQKADYGLVGDLFKIVPLLTQEFKKLLAE